MSINRHYLRGYAKALSFFKQASIPTTPGGSLPVTDPKNQGGQPNDSSSKNVQNDVNAGLRAMHNDTTFDKIVFDNDPYPFLRSNKLRFLEDVTNTDAYRNALAMPISYSHKADTQLADNFKEKNILSRANNWLYWKLQKALVDADLDNLKTKLTDAAAAQGTSNYNPMSFKELIKNKKSGDRYIAVPSSFGANDYNTRKDDLRSIYASRISELANDVAHNWRGTYREEGISPEERKLRYNTALTTDRINRAWWDDVLHPYYQDTFNVSPATATGFGSLESSYRNEYYRRYNRYPTNYELTNFMYSNPGLYLNGQAPWRWKKS